MGFLAEYSTLEVKEEIVKVQAKPLFPSLRQYLGAVGVQSSICLSTRAIHHYIYHIFLCLP